MLSELQLRIIIRALEIRKQRGEKISEVINDYPKLETKEKEKILGIMNQN